jgi:group I intron endonuclease
VDHLPHIDHLPADKHGVYRVLNVKNGKSYVGSAARASIRRRCYLHRWDLERGKHPNRHLQRAFGKHGPSVFRFEVLELCEPAQCLVREQWHLDQLKTADYRFGYNLSPTATSPFGTKHTPETRARMSAAQREVMDRPGQREKASRAQRKRFENPEELEKNRAAQRKRFENPEERARTAEATRRAMADPTVKAKCAAPHVGRAHSPEEKARRVAALRGKKRSEATKEKLREATRRRMAKPGALEQLHASIAKRHEERRGKSLLYVWIRADLRAALTDETWPAGRGCRGAALVALVEQLLEEYLRTIGRIAPA